MSLAPLLYDLAVLLRQAQQQYHSGRLELPKSLKPMAIVENADFKRMGFVAQSSSRILIAFRGTEEREELLQGMAVSQMNYPYLPSCGKTHRGFTNLYGKLRPAILRALRSSRRKKPLYITGHSLGGALAALCALDPAVRRRAGPVRLYTFGSPRVGDRAFAQAVTRAVRTSVRVYNIRDWIPFIPPENLLGIISYVHVGKNYPLKGDADNLLHNHSISSYIHALSKKLNTRNSIIVRTSVLRMERP